MHGGALDYKALLTFLEKFDGRSIIDEYFLIMFDQRGKGLTERFNNESDLSFEIYQNDLEAIVDHFSPETDVIFIAHSFGGIITANYMNQKPNRVAGAVFLESGAFKNSLSSTSPMDLTDEWLNDLMWGQQIIGASTHEEVDFNFAAIMLAPNYNPSNGTVISPPFWRVGAVAQHWLSSESNYDFTENLSLINKPILFIAGSKT